MNPVSPAVPRRVSVRRPAGVHPSLVDIMCCLVILFLLTSLVAVRSQQEARERTLPALELAKISGSEGSAPAKAKPPLTVSVRSGPEYFFGERAVGLEELTAALAATKPNEVEIRGDATVPHGAVMAALRACQEAGVARVAMTYEIPEGGVRNRLAATNPTKDHL